MVEMLLDSRKCLHYELLFTRAVPFRGGFMSLLLRRSQPAALIVPLVLCFSFGFSAQALNAQTVKVHVSSKAGDRLTPKADLQFTDAKLTVGETFQINDSVKYQKMDGFGASLMEAGIITLNTLPADKQEEVLRSLFDPNYGAGFTATRR